MGVETGRTGSLSVGVSGFCLKKGDSQVPGIGHGRCSLPGLGESRQVALAIFPVSCIVRPVSVFTRRRQHERRQ